MKQKIFAAITACIAGIMIFASCDKVKDAIKVDFDATSSDISFTIPVLEESGEATLAEDQAYLNVDSLIKAHNDQVGVENIKSVKIKSCTITLINGDSLNNFSVLESCKVQLFSDSKPDMITIAEISGNPDTETHTLELPVKSDLDLAPYFSSRYFTYKLTGKSRRGTTIEMECKVSASYNVVAGL